MDINEYEITQLLALRRPSRETVSVPDATLWKWMMTLTARLNTEKAVGWNAIAQPCFSPETLGKREFVNQ